MRKKIENVIIVDSKKLANLKNEISKDGVSKIFVISDFDRTLTKLFVKGERINSLIYVLQKGNYLSNKYSEEARALFKKYYQIETDSKISLKERKKKMEEWWKKHFELLKKFSFNQRHLKKVIESKKVKLREGAREFLKLLYRFRIPLLIISSSGLGVDGISMFLKKEGNLYRNIYIISNSLNWDKKRNLIGINPPIIYSLNKTGKIIKKMPIFKIIKKKRNIMVLGDNIEDCQVIDGLNYQNVIKIGFLNEEIKKNLRAYKTYFNVLILNDGEMSYINNLFKEIML